MRSSAAVAGNAALAQDYNLLRADAQGASFLLVHQQATPGMTVAVEPGIFWIGATKVTFAGGNSGTITAPTTHPRIDLLTIDTSGTLAFVTGTEASSPTAPAYPLNKMVLAEIYNVVGETIIYDNANQTAGQGYITDARPFLYNNVPAVVESSSTYSPNTAYQNTSGRGQLHMITMQLACAGTAQGLASGSFKTGPSLVTEVALALLNSIDAGHNQITENQILTAYVPPGYFFRLDTTATGTGSASINYWQVLTF